MESKYRNDIDGLRALSIILVIVYHAFPSALPGGFIGVDVFFVISGYLITKVLLTDFNVHKEIKFIQFYSKRINRIFPSLIVMLILSLILGILVLNPVELIQFLKNTKYSIGFLSNFNLINEAGYFDTSSEKKPLLNLWSLAIEEQFYILWPFALYLLLKLRLFNIRVLLFLASASFIANILILNTNPSSAFFLPYTRFWELILGSMLLFNNCQFIKKFHLLENLSSEMIGNLKCFFGLSFIILGSICIDNSAKFPGFLALVPTVGAALIITSNENSFFNKQILSSKYLVWIGLLSYPLYLFHWPLLSFSYIFQGQTPSISIRILIIFISTFLAFLTYRFIEITVRNNKYKNSPMILIFVMFCLFIFTTLITLPSNPFNINLRSKYEFSWNNSQTDLICLNKYFKNMSHPEFCRLQKAGDPTVLLMGDSMSFQLFSGLTNQLPSKENVLSINQGNCATFMGASSRHDYKMCETISNKSLEIALSTEKIHTVIISSAPLKFSSDINTINFGYGKNKIDSLHSFENILSDNMRQIFKMLISKNKQIIFVPFNPQLPFDLNYCINNINDNNSLNCPMNKADHIKNGQEYKKIVNSVLNEFPSVKVFNTDKFFCDFNNCYAMMNGNLLYRDQWHLSTQGSIYIAGPLTQLINK